MRLPRKPEVMSYMYPGEVLDFDFDFSNDLAEGDTISASAVTVTPEAGLTLGAKTAEGPRVKQWATAVTGGARYLLECSVTTAGGRTHIVYIIIPVAATPTP